MFVLLVNSGEHEIPVTVIILYYNVVCINIMYMGIAMGFVYIMNLVVLCVQTDFIENLWHLENMKTRINQYWLKFVFLHILECYRHQRLNSFAVYSGIDSLRIINVILQISMFVALPGCYCLTVWSYISNNSISQWTKGIIQHL